MFYEMDLEFRYRSHIVLIISLFLNHDNMFGYNIAIRIPLHPYNRPQLLYSIAGFSLEQKLCARNSPGARGEKRRSTRDFTGVYYNIIALLMSQRHAPMTVWSVSKSFIWLTVHNAIKFWPETAKYEQDVSIVEIRTDVQG